MNPKSSSSMHNLFYTKLEENFIRREKKRRQDLLRDIAKLRLELPMYWFLQKKTNKSTLDRFKMALFLELQEQGYESTEDYIKKLFDFQEKMKQPEDSKTLSHMLPDLKHSKNELKRLSEALKRAEDHHRVGHTDSEMDELLRAGIEFAFGESNEFWWLAEELILQSVSISTEFSKTGRHEALSRYCLAKILIDKANNFETAEQHLVRARELSEGKPWNAAKFLPNHSDPLFMCSSYLLHLCYMKQARQILKSDPKKATNLALMAKKRATEACFHEGETLALLLKGDCELIVNNTQSAIASFNKAYFIQSRIGSQEGMCQAKVALAKAYLQAGNTKQALQNLLLLKEKAEQFHLKFYLAQAYRYLGEYYLNNGEPHKATIFLKDALEMFTILGDSIEADQVRNLEALSAGLELMPDYIELITKTDSTHPEFPENLRKLVKWKDSRKPFWNTSREKVVVECSMENLLEKHFKKSKSSSAGNLETQTSSDDTLKIIKEFKNHEAIQTHEQKDSYESDTYVDSEIITPKENETETKTTEYIN